VGKATGDDNMRGIAMVVVAFEYPQAVGGRQDATGTSKTADGKPRLDVQVLSK
jgi:hypothetical protein